ncbi:YpeB-like protein with putative protease inhibitory function [Rhodobacter viridis]|uniref:YpeB-like protein with putative protease inhibitory function n=1 Tax=Rhodobacter viridis TaxID=1054202 RepID=A0A318U733_9RHOB|nr:PepSY domain-containing protein [Rhodobacter viridis]PYF07759.1 YpeB-like protein with putative protease inhibitory function [Rhodobacter viridis]
MIKKAMVLTVLGENVCAAEDCAAPMITWQPIAAIEARAQAAGWQVEWLQVEDGCYALGAHDRMGRDLSVTLDPATLAIIETNRNDERRSRSRSQKQEE